MIKHLFFRKSRNFTFFAQPAKFWEPSKNLLFFLVIILANFGLFAKKSNNSLSKLDTLINYRARSIKYIDINNEKCIILARDAQLSYKDILLTADTIKYNLSKNTVSASFHPDTIFYNSKIDTILYRGLPTIKEGDEVITGKSIKYNLKTQIGKIVGAKTVMEGDRREDDTYISTGQMVKLENNDIHGKNVKITNCDHEQPHWCFGAEQFMVTENDWVFARPVVLYLDEIPLGWFPYLFYKRTKGRQSGLIIPSYTYNSRKGNGLKHLGFFWDISDYMDYTILTDYYDYEGYLLKQNFRYAQRYKIKGNLEASFANNHKSHDWKFNAHHNQIFTPSTTLDLDFNYVTRRSLVRSLGNSSYERMQNKLYSEGKFEKRWIATGDNFRVVSTMTQYVDTAIVKYTLPRISYNLTGRNPFKKSSFFSPYQVNMNFSSYRDVEFNKALEDYSDISNLSFNINNSFKKGGFSFSSKETYKGKYSVLENYQTFSDTNSFSKVKFDSLNYEQAFLIQNSLSYKYSLFRYLAINNTISYQKDFAFAHYDDSGKFVKNLKSRDLYNFAISANTKLYGIFEPNIWLFKKFRHTIIPRLELKYIPDFASASQGYFYTDSLGKKQDKFSKSMIGATPKNKSMKLSLNLDNILEGKIYKDRDKDKTNNKKILTFNAWGDYDFLKDSNRLSDINFKLNSELYNGKIFSKSKSSLSLKLTAGSNFILSPYNEQGNYLNKNFDFWKENPFRIKDYSYQYRITFPYQIKEILSKKLFGAKEEESIINISKREAERFTKIDLNLKGNLNFSETYSKLKDYSKHFNFTLTSEILLTKNWKINYNLKLNFNDPKKVSKTTIEIFRDMHCWEASFEWDITRQGFKLLISPKSNIFKDLKYDKDTQRVRW